MTTRATSPVSHPDLGGDAGLRVLRLCSAFEVPADLVARLARRHPAVGGVAGAAAALTRALDRRGLAQHVVTGRPPGAPPDERAGARADVVRVGRPGWYLPAARSRLRAGGAGGFDLVHVHQGEDVGLLPLAAAVSRRLAVPLVVTVHSSLRHTVAPDDVRCVVRAAVGGRFERRVLGEADAVVTPTAAAATALLGDGVPAQRLFVLPVGVDTGLFRSPTPDPALRALPGPRILAVGGLHRDGDLVTLLRAMLVLRTPGAHLVVVGDGPQRRLLRHLVRQLGLGASVTMLGAVPHARIPGLLAAADVLALPRRYAGAGTAAVEAARLGLPVVATRTGGLASVVIDGRTGHLVPPGDPGAFAAALDRVLGDTRHRAVLHANAKDRAAAYDADALAARVHALYRTLTDRPSRTAAAVRLPALLD